MPKSQDTFEYDLENAAASPNHRHHGHYQKKWNRKALFKRAFLAFTCVCMALFVVFKFSNGSIDFTNTGLMGSFGESTGRGAGGAASDNTEHNNNKDTFQPAIKIGSIDPAKSDDKSTSNTDDVVEKYGKKLIDMDAVQSLSSSNSKNDPDKKLKEDLTSNKNSAPKEKISLTKGKMSKVELLKENTVANSLDSGLSGFDAGAEFKAIVSLSPVVIFTWGDSKVPIPNVDGVDETQNPQIHTNTLLKILKNNYQITPVPTFVSLNKHPHYKELAIYINKLYHKLNNLDKPGTQSLFSKSKSKSRADSLSSEDGGALDAESLSKYTNTYGLPELQKSENILPGLIIAGKPIGNSRQLELAHKSGNLLSVLKSLGDGIFNVERVS